MSGSTQTQENINQTEKLKFPLSIVKGDERLAFEKRNLDKLKNKMQIQKFGFASVVILAFAATIVTGVFTLGFGAIPVGALSGFAIVGASINYKKNMKHLEDLNKSYTGLYNKTIQSAKWKNRDPKELDNIKIDKTKLKALEKQKIVEDTLLQRTMGVKEREKALSNLVGSLNPKLIKQLVNDDNMSIRNFKKQFKAELDRVVAPVVPPKPAVVSQVQNPNIMSQTQHFVHVTTNYPAYVTHYQHPAQGLYLPPNVQYIQPTYVGVSGNNVTHYVVPPNRWPAAQTTYITHYPGVPVRQQHQHPPVVSVMNTPVSPPPRTPYPISNAAPTVQVRR